MNKLDALIENILKTLLFDRTATALIAFGAVAWACSR